MAAKLKTCSALAAFLAATSPCWAMSTVTAPSNSDGQSRFSDPNSIPNRAFSGAVTTVIIGNGSSSFGYGGSATAGNRPFGNSIPGNRAGGFGDPAFPDVSPFPSNPGFPNSGFSNPGFPNSGYPYVAPPGASPGNPFAGQRDPFAPNFRGNGR
ncbi:MAG TPA: hypothetical protein VHT51_05055 [Micropepsaceae bacterium]|jgi:hypothetical protein|nr:hypothetical protein [Micropepsaceae bacterium]